MVAPSRTGEADEVARRGVGWVRACGHRALRDCAWVRADEATAPPSASPCPRLPPPPQALCAGGPPLQGARALGLATLAADAGSCSSLDGGGAEDSRRPPAVERRVPVGVRA